MDDGLQREPLEPRAHGESCMECLPGRLAAAAVEACRPRCGDERVGAFGERRVDMQRVAADDPARRMHEHVVADRRRLRVKACQHPQRTLVAAVQHRAAVALVPGFAPVRQRQAACPAHQDDVPGCELQKPA